MLEQERLQPMTTQIYLSVIMYMISTVISCDVNNVKRTYSIQQSKISANIRLALYTGTLKTEYQY